MTPSFRALLEKIKGIHTLSVLECHPGWAGRIDELWWSEDGFDQQAPGRLGQCVAFVLDGQSYLLAEIPIDSMDGKIAYFQSQVGNLPIARLEAPVEVEVRVCVEGPLGGTAKSVSFHDPETGACLMAMQEVTVHLSNGWKDDYDVFVPQVTLCMDPLAMERTRLGQSVPLPQEGVSSPIPRAPRL